MMIHSLSFSIPSTSTSLLPHNFAPNRKKYMYSTTFVRPPDLTPTRELVTNFPLPVTHLYRTDRLNIHTVEEIMNESP